MRKKEAIRVNSISKAYKLYNSPKDRFKETFHPIRKKYSHDFYALKKVSFDVKRGDTVGIIGKNGSGKSTLLQIITGVLTPSSGVVEVNGRISALLELGAGFNPEFTGMENIFFNGQIMGFSRKDMEERIDDILTFADIGEFVYQPVKTYSSGMFVRLAFALAISVDPDILIIDEALAVGDTKFQMKCIDRINYMIENGVTLLFVSHDPGAVKRLCNRAVLLEKGNKIKESNPEEVLDLYNAMLADDELTSVVVNQIEDDKVQIVSGTGEAKITDIKISAQNGRINKVFEVGEKLCIQITITAFADIPQLVLGFQIKDRLGQIMFGTNTFHTKQTINNVYKGNKYSFNIHFNMNLGPGDYSVSIGLTSNDTHLENNYEWKDYALIFKVVNSKSILFVGMTWIPVRFDIKEIATKI